MKKKPYMFSWVWFLWAVDSRSIPRPTPLGQLHDHGSQLRWVSADGRISNGWSNSADTQYQMAAVIVGGHAALVTQAWLGTRALTVVRQRSSNSMVLKRRSDFMLESHTSVDVILHGNILISRYQKDPCTSCSHGSGSVSPFGDILSPGASRVLSRSSTRRWSWVTVRKAQCKSF